MYNKILCCLDVSNSAKLSFVILENGLIKVIIQNDEKFDYLIIENKKLKNYIEKEIDELENYIF